MSESAIDWIKRHRRVYTAAPGKTYSPFDVCRVSFEQHDQWPDAYVHLENNESDALAINLETAEDCEALCRLLRITPEVRS